MFISSPVNFYSLTCNIVCTVISDFFKLNKSVFCTVLLIYNVLTCLVFIIAVNNKSTCEYAVPLSIESYIFSENLALSCRNCAFLVSIPTEEIVFIHSGLISTERRNVILVSGNIFILTVDFAALSIKGNIVLFDCDYTVEGTLLSIGFIVVVCTVK